jgi:hypothetical protein
MWMIDAVVPLELHQNDRFGIFGDDINNPFRYCLSFLYKLS